MEIPFIQLLALMRLGPQVSTELLPVSTVSFDCRGAYMLKIHSVTKPTSACVLAGGFAQNLNPQTLTGSIKGKRVNHSHCSPRGDKLL